MKRRLFNLLAEVSLVLFLMTVLLCARGLYFYDRITFTWHPHTISGQTYVDRQGVTRSWLFPRSIRFHHYSGSWYVEYQPHDWQNDSFYKQRRLSDGDPSLLRLRFDIAKMPGLLGFHVGDRFAALGGRSLERYVAIPDWAVAAILMILPARWLMALRRKRRLGRVGFCQMCGYDLRATPDRCPECGTVPKVSN